MKPEDNDELQPPGSIGAATPELVGIMAAASATKAH